MKLYDYFRSTASYRVRIVLNLKKIDHSLIPIHLLNNGGEQHSANYKSVNPQELVPTLETNESLIHQSLAIIEYLEECYPSPSLYPTNALMRAKSRSLALMIACDIHPINCLRVLNQLKTQFKADEPAIKSWMYHWFELGFTAIETFLEKEKATEGFCINNQLSIADIFLIPQVYSANRFEFDLKPFPLIRKVNDHCLKIPEFVEAQPKST